MTTPASLTPEQLEDIRRELNRTLLRLERSVKVNGNGGGRPPELDQSAVGRLSRIEALQNQGLTRNLQDRERVKLEQVLQALARMEAGTFGLCLTCHDPIRFERLLVFPETLHCAACGSGN